MITKLIGQSPAALELLDHTSKAAMLHKSILVIGERGTGKELIAERLHYLSSRWQQPYVKLNCAAISETLMESELFGHETGAFTGANRTHIGKFERAHQGSLFLDEIATMTPRVQEKLLRVLEYGEFERVGGQKTISVDVRLIAATNVDLPSYAQQGLFREDLLDRLSFDVITLPPLRARENDVLLLATHFAVQMSVEMGWSVFAGFSPDVEKQLLQHPWPGNIRELRNTIERSIYHHDNEHEPINQLRLDPFASPWRLVTPLQKQSRALSLADPFKKQCQEFEIALIQYALQQHNGNQTHAAAALQLSYDQLRSYLKKYQIKASDFQP